MKKKRLAHVETKTDYVKFQGGLVLETPALSVSPGTLFFCQNYEADFSGGYRRIDGYERYSGMLSPSDSKYLSCDTVFTDVVAVGNIVTGETSGATGVVITVGTDYMNLVKVIGAFQAEDFTVAGMAKGTISLISVNGETMGIDHAKALSASADQTRSNILAPAGSGPVRGLSLLKGVLYGFRDNEAGTAGTVQKATAAGWELIPLYMEIPFSGGLEPIPDGSGVSQTGTGATATVKRTVLESGAWTGGTAAGRLIIADITGTFNATGAIQVSAVTKVTAAGLPTQIIIAPGGRYESIAYNFQGSADTKRIYGCDGVNKGFELEGDLYIPINSGMAIDTPEFVFTHQKQLFFSFKGSSQNSGVGTPYEWKAISGALQIGIGDLITGYASLTGKAMAIFSRDSTNKLVGTSVDDFSLDSISDEVGCIPRTAQKLGHAYCLDDRGVIKVYPTDTYGNFAQGAVSRHIQSLIDSMRKVAVASSVYRTRNQYRIYGNDGSGLCMTILAKGVAFTYFQYPDNVACMVSGEDATGKDVVFWGSDEGMVYQADKGSSFDGAEIEAFLGLQFNSSNSPSVSKTYRKATIEMTSSQYSSIRLSADFSYSDPDIPMHMAEPIAVFGLGGFWDVNNWDEFFYDAATVSSPSIGLEGTGTNIGMIAYSKSAIDFGHKLDGAIIHYTPRRIVK